MASLPEIEERLDHLLGVPQKKRMMDLINRREAKGIEWEKIIPLKPEEIDNYSSLKSPTEVELAECMKKIAVVC